MQCRFNQCCNKFQSVQLLNVAAIDWWLESPASWDARTAGALWSSLAEAGRTKTDDWSTIVDCRFHDTRHDLLLPQRRRPVGGRIHCKKYPYIRAGPAASLFPRFTDANAYGTGSVKMRKTRYKISADVRMFFYSVGLYDSSSCHRRPSQPLNRPNAINLPSVRNQCYGTGARWHRW